MKKDHNSWILGVPAQIFYVNKMQQYDIIGSNKSLEVA